jgi:hypothetical protein
MAKNLMSVQDSLEFASCKVGFLHDVFARLADTDETPEFSRQGLAGLAIILGELEEQLESAVDRISRLQKGVE